MAIGSSPKAGTASMMHSSRSLLFIFDSSCVEECVVSLVADVQEVVVQ